MTLTIALIGCSRTKRHVRPTEFVAARDLYIGDLFLRRVEHVEAREIPWMILSGSGSLLGPDTPVRPYDRTPNAMTPVERASWHAEIAYQVVDWIERLGYRSVSSLTVELHAGRSYCEPLQQLLETLGCNVVRPVEGLGIGQQKAYYIAQAKHLCGGES